MGFDARKWVTEPHTDYLRYEPDWSGLSDAFVQGAQRSRDEAYRNATLEREKDRDRNNDERARIGEKQRAQEMLMSDRRAGQREDLYRLQENRRENESRLNRERLHRADHEALLQDLYSAINTPGQDPLTQQNRVRAAQEALKRAGYVTEEVEDTPSGATTPPLAPDGQPVGFQPPPVQRTHLSPTQERQTSRDLDQAGNFYLNKLKGGKSTTLPKTSGTGSAKDAALSRDMDAAESTYMDVLQKPSASSGWLPGQPALPRRIPTDVAQSDAMLDPDDPYNQIVQ